MARAKSNHGGLAKLKPVFDRQPEQLPRATRPKLPMAPWRFGDVGEPGVGARRQAARLFWWATATPGAIRRAWGSTCVCIDKAERKTV